MSEREHLLLPWYVNGTLDPGERAAFEAHLRDCAACRREGEQLRSMMAELERHGEDLLGDHPTAERLVGLLLEEPHEASGQRDAAGALRRHLALCETCALEARWILGQEPAGAGLTGPAQPAAAGARPGRALAAAPRSRAWLWPALAAVLVLAVAVPLIWRQAPGPDAGVSRVTLVEPTARAGSEAPTRVAVDAAAGQVMLLLPVDAPVTDFPLTLQVVDAGRRTVLRIPDIRRDALYDGRFLFVHCGRSRCPDGRYLARLWGASGEAMATEYPFLIETVPAREEVTAPAPGS